MNVHKMAVAGDTFQFSVDGVLVDSLNINAIATGRVGLCIGGCVAEFDSVVITGSDVPDLGPSGYAVSSMGKLATTWAAIRAY